MTLPRVPRHAPSGRTAAAAALAALLPLGCTGAITYTRSADVSTDALSVSVAVGDAPDDVDGAPRRLTARVNRTDLVQDCSGFISFCDSTAVRLTDGDRIVVSRGDRREQLYRRAEPYAYTGTLDWRVADTDPLTVAVRRPGRLADTEAAFDLPRVSSFSVDEADTTVSAGTPVTVRWELEAPAAGVAPTLRALFSSCVDANGEDLPVVDFGVRRTELPPDARSLAIDTAGLRAPPAAVPVARCDWTFGLVLDRSLSVRTEELARVSLEFHESRLGLPLTERLALTVLYPP